MGGCGNGATEGCADAWRQRKRQQRAARFVKTRAHTGRSAWHRDARSDAHAKIASAAENRIDRCARASVAHVLTHTHASKLDVQAHARGPA
eukprot:5061978-Pleurochrysis_carterae.AAC.1